MVGMFVRAMSNHRFTVYDFVLSLWAEVQRQAGGAVVLATSKGEIEVDRQVFLYKFDI